MRLPGQSKLGGQVVEIDKTSRLRAVTRRMPPRLDTDGRRPSLLALREAH